MGELNVLRTFVDVTALEKKIKYEGNNASGPGNPVSLYHFQIILGYFPIIQNSEFYSHSYFGVRSKNVTASHENMLCYRELSVMTRKILQACLFLSICSLAS